MISVILSTYNVSVFIEQTIRSVLEQGYQNLEVVVVDDGSIDGTPEIIQELFCSFPIKLIKVVHSGNVGKNLNIGLKASEGEFIAVLGADDLWELNKLETQLPYLTKYPVVCSNACIINEKGTCVRDYYLQQRGSRTLMLAEMLEYNQVIASSVIARKDVMIECGGFDESVGNRAEDYYLWLQILNKYEIFLIDETLVRYRKHNKNLSSRSIQDRKELADRVIEIRKSFEDASEKLRKNSIRGMINEYLTFAAECYERSYYELAHSYATRGLELRNGIFRRSFLKLNFYKYMSRIHTVIRRED